MRTGWGSALPRRLALVAVAALIPVLAGCEAGNNAPTLAFHYPTDAAGIAEGNLSIRNVFVLGGPLGKNLQKGQSASLFLSIINEGAADKLISITAPGTAASVSLPSGGVPVILNRPVFFSGPKPQLVLNDLTKSIRNGSDVRLILTFVKAGPITLVVPVVPRATPFATYAPPAPSPTPTATATGAAATAAKGKGKKHHGSASPSPTITPGTSASPSPSPST
jgi:copper(I)-binding protein